MARQKRITIDNDNYYTDLLFYHRRLKRLIAVELKPGKIEPLQLEQSNIKATEYLTRLPDLKLLEQKLRQAVETAKNRSE